MTLHSALIESSTHISRRDAETLLAHLLSRDRAWIFAHPEAELSPEQLEALRALTLRRAALEPLQHLTGQKEFFGLNLRVTRDTLIPRPETELLVEAVLHWLAARPTPNRPPRIPLRILDIGTGSGAVALALAANSPSASITATDISPAALAVARENADRLNLSIRFIHSDLFAAPEIQQAAPFDVIVSNPPYVALADAPHLQPEVVRFEPAMALFAGSDGLDLYRRLIPQAHAHLRPDGLLALEFGFGQSDGLSSIFETESSKSPADNQRPDGPASAILWQDLRFLDDYAGIPRIALATRS